jgi:hypothetical protein
MSVARSGFGAVRFPTIPSVGQGFSGGDGPHRFLKLPYSTDHRLELCHWTADNVPISCAGCVRLTSGTGEIGDRGFLGRE